MTALPARVALARSVAGVVLVALGILLWAGSHVVAGGEAHSYTAGEPPPHYVDLHAGKRYVLAVPGGRAAAQRAGVSLDSLRCTETARSGDPSTLRLTVEPDGTKAVNQIATFQAPVDGLAHVTCTGLTQVYVDNATGDPSGFLLIAAMIAFAVGAPVLLSAGRSVWSSRPSTTV